MREACGRVAALRPLANESILFPQTAKNHELQNAGHATCQDNNTVPQYRMISVRQE